VSPCAVLEGLFVGAGADVLVVDGEGSTLLHVVAGRRIEDELELSRWDSEAERWEQVSPVTKVFERLLGMGLDPRREDAQMRTAIDVAVARGRSQIVELFAEQQ
jgi:ankyrin repeat protein